MRPRKMLRIARWESTKGVGAVAVVVAVLAFVLAAGTVAVGGGVALEDGIYRVGLSADSPFHDPVAEDPTFAVVEPSADATRGDRLVADDRYDLYLAERPRGTTIYVATSDGEPTEKSRAALAALQESVDQYNDRRMHLEENQSAAFPVAVSIQYVEREGTEIVGPGERGIDGGSADGDGGTTHSGDGDGSSGAGGGSGGDGGTADSGSTDGSVGAPSLGAFDLFGTAGTSRSPSDIAPPFPFQSLVLAFLFVLSMNFLLQAYGSSMLSERLNRRDELLLVAAMAVLAVVLAATLAVAIPVRQRAQLTYSFGALAAFSATAFLPEHPAKTVALLAVDSASPTTYAHLGGYVVLAVGFAAVFRHWLAGVDAESLG